MPENRRRKKRLFLFAGTVVALILFLVVLPNGWMAWRLNQKLDGLRDAGQPLNIADLAIQPEPGQTDARQLLDSITPALRSIEAQLKPVIERESTDSLTADEVALIATTWTTYPRIIPTLAEAADAPAYGITLPAGMTGTALSTYAINTTLNHRTIARILSLEAQRQMATGDPNGALATMVTLLKLCRHFDNEPAIMSYLVSLACRSVAFNQLNTILRHSELSPESRKTLDAELAQHDLSQTLHHALVTERVLGKANFQEFSTASIPPAVRAVGLHWIIRPYWLMQSSKYLDYLDQEIEIAQLPVNEMRAARKKITPNQSSMFVSLLAPAIDRVQDATARSAVQLRAIQILNALEKQETPPEKFNPSRLGLPAELFVDPFNGKPLQIQHLETGWLIYAVGPDLKDDGGQITDFTDIGFGPLTDPEQRSP